MKAWIWWYNPRNWLAETRKQEIRRRMEAMESHIQDLSIRANMMNNQINVLIQNASDMRAVMREHEWNDEPTELSNEEPCE